jgi:hypothetical protein
MMKNFFYLGALIFFSSCMGYHYTRENGTRVNNSKFFKYNKPRFRNRDKFPIEMNAIYVLDSQYSKWNDIKYSKKNKEFIRFFRSGQVLLAYSDSASFMDLANNKEVGTQGYYVVAGDKIKISFFSYDIMLRQLRRFGKILSNGDIMLYDEEISIIGFWGALERSGRKSFWRKVKSEKIIEYTPDW